MEEQKKVNRSSCVDGHAFNRNPVDKYSNSNSNPCSFAHGLFGILLWDHHVLATHFVSYYSPPPTLAFGVARFVPVRLNPRQGRAKGFV